MFGRIAHLLKPVSVIAASSNSNHCFPSVETERQGRYQGPADPAFHPGYVDKRPAYLHAIACGLQDPYSAVCLMFACSSPDFSWSAFICSDFISSDRR